MNGEYTLSSAQRNIFNLEKALDGTSVNTLSALLPVESIDDTAAGLDHIFAACDTLRTEIRLNENELPVQYVRSYTGVEYDFFDCSDSEMKEKVRVLNETPIPVLESPLYSFTFFKTETGNYLLTRLHHLIADGRSLEVLKSCLSSDEIDIAGARYEDYVASEEKYLASKAYERDRRYWNELLSSEHNMASFKAGNGLKSSRYSFKLPSETLALMHDYCKGHSISMASLIYSCFGTCFYRFTDTLRPTIGTPVDMRGSVSMDAAGMYVNTLPLILPVERNMKVKDAVSAVDTAWLDLLKHRRMPYEHIADEKLFDIAVSYMYEEEDGSRFWIPPAEISEEMVFHFTESESHMTVDVDYHVDLFTPAEIQYMLDCFGVFVCSFLKNDDEYIENLDILPAGEKESLIGNLSDMDMPYSSCIEYMLRNSNPSDICCLEGGREYIYENLYYLAAKIAASIPYEGRTVGIAMGRSFNTLAAMAGVLLSGCSFMCISSTVPRNRLDAMLGSSDVDIIIDDAYIADLHAVKGSSLLSFDRGSLSAPAYVIYTSGSTGTPKGVRISQRNLLCLALTIKDMYPRSVLSICNTAFDAFMLESIVPLMNGKTIYIAGDEETESPSVLASYLSDDMLISMTPGRLMQYMKDESFKEGMKKLSAVVCGGESFPADLERRIHEINGEIRVYNQYGPTETTVAVTMKEVEGDSPSCGRPLSGSRIYVLDRSMNILPRMCTGEIYVSGMQVGEYVDGSISDAYMEDMFNPGHVMYRSGDLGYIRLDGELVVRGRADSQIKIRGLRIEIDEIRKVLEKKVTSCHVMADGDNILAFHTSDMSEISLKSYMGQYLPSYMIPVRIFSVSEIPLTPNGKVDEEALLEYVDIYDDREYMELSDEEELAAERIAVILGDTIGKTMGIYDSYRMAGGTSLTSMEAAGRINDEYGCALRISDILSSDTAAALALLLDERREDRECEYYDEPQMTGIQKGIYLESMTDDTGLKYNMPGIFDVTGLDRDRLMDAICSLVQADDIFKISFKDAKVHVSEKVSLKIPVISSSASLSRVMEDFVRQFDLAEAPLMRAAICEMEEHTYLLCDMHHIIGDGMSMNVMMKRISAIYEGKPVSEPYSYLSYMREKHPVSSKFWTEELSGVSSVKLRTLDTVSAYAMDIGSIRFSDAAAALGILFSRLTGTEKICIGIPSANRMEVERRDSIGPYINTLPLALDAHGDREIAEYVSEVEDKVLRLLEHMDEPLIDILECIDRDREEGPLVNVLLNETPVDTENIYIGNTKIEYMPWDTGVSKMDMECDLEKSGDNDILKVTAGMDIEDIESMMKYLDDILDAIKAGTGKIRDISYGTLAMSKREAAGDNDYHINDRFHDAVNTNGEKTACIFGGLEYSYASMESMAAYVTEILRASEIQPGSAVGVRMHRGVEMMAALIGILDAGCIYVPMDPKLPDRRIEEMRKLGGVSAILMDRFEIQVFDERDTYPSDLFAILFTSGSTGKPKGVKIRHDSVANLNSYMQRILEQDTILCSTGIAFDVYLTESIIALSGGKTITILSDDEMMDPKAAAEHVKKDGIQMIQMTPSRMQTFLMDGSFAGAMKNIKTVLLAGEKLSSSLASRILKCMAEDGRVFNLYGPAEATVYCTYGVVTGTGQVTIGKAADGCSIYILDEDQKPCIIGETGEIYIGGRCLTDGYVQNDALTEERYIYNPFDGGKMYRSGDLGYMRPDGDIVYVGRNDDQIKLNGQRVEPEEVTGAMLMSGAVSDAYCLAGRRPSGGAQLIGFIRAENAYEAGPLVLEHLRKTIPSYMIPRVLVPVEEIPGTITGKADRKALLALYEEYVESMEAEEDVDERLSDIWKEILDVPQVDSHLSFFSQGGTSIDALKAVLMYFDIGIDMTLADFYANPSLAEQTAYIQGDKRSSSSTYEEVPVLERREYVPDETGGILLTGATGFLGIHLLKEIKKMYPSREIYVLLRTDHLDEEYMSMFGERVEVVKVFGDISKEDLGLEKHDYYALADKVSQVISCAADVRHYVTDEEAMMNVNVEGVRRLAEFALMADAELVQVSTASLSGDPDLGNIYLRTKKMAEDVLKGTPGLKYRIFRAGRLAGRMSDGRFQKNRETNAFFLLLKSIKTTKTIPERMRNMRVEITPVDWAASTLASAIHMGDSDRDICYPYMYSMEEIADAMGVGLSVLPDGIFEEEIRRMMNRENMEDISYLVDFYHQIKPGGIYTEYMGGVPLDLACILKEFRDE